MKKIHCTLAFSLLALSPFILTGCAGDEKSGDSAEIAAPLPVAEKLNEDLRALAVRVQTTDAALSRLVAESATDPSDRFAVFNKAVRDMGSSTAVSLGADLQERGVVLVAGWNSTAAGLTDPELKKTTFAAGAEVAASFDTLNKALRGADAALLWHASLLGQVRSALGASPTPDRIVAVRPSVQRVLAAGQKVSGWLAYAGRVATLAGHSPVPLAVPVVAAPLEQSGTSETASAPVPPLVEPAMPPKTEAPAPAPVAPPPAPASVVVPAKALIAPGQVLLPAPTAKPAVQKADLLSDPIPEPKEV